MSLDRVYVRFVCFKPVEDSPRQRMGLFQALKEAEQNDHSPDWALAELGACCDWFNANLRVPYRFHRGGWKGLGQPGLSWFKAWSAEDHIRTMHRFRRAIGACGVHVEVLTTRDPGSSSMKTSIRSSQNRARGVSAGSDVARTVARRLAPSARPNSGRVVKGL